jgi:hypothetical protein
MYFFDITSIYLRYVFDISSINLIEEISILNRIYFLKIYTFALVLMITGLTAAISIQLILWQKITVAFWAPLSEQ